MKGFSKVIIMGNLTRDPELRSTSTGNTVCAFTVAVNRGFKDQSGNQREEVSFFDCSAWNKLGETINQYAKKGTGVLISGRLEQRSWEDKATGQKRSRVEIVVEDFNFIGNSRDNNGASGDDAMASVSDSNVPDDIPEGEIDLSEVPF